ncbi:MAG: dihydropteroate synthase [Burkholderia sp.]|nr:dihydropteroate synthase [Burkholderia sp.]
MVFSSFHLTEGRIAPLYCGRFKLTFERPLVMGILNVTPDSFSDGGCFLAHDDALQKAEKMIAEGADLLDIGGESTRPGSIPIQIDVELNRVIPLLDDLKRFNIPLSIDTYKPEIMSAAIDSGCDMINDIWSFRKPGAIDAVRDKNVGLCVMHMLGDPRTMQISLPVYRDIISNVRNFLSERIDFLRSEGIKLERICVDPGFGFGKTTIKDNYELLAALQKVAPSRPDNLSYPVLVGISRKAMLGAVISDKPPEKRIAASVSAALCAIERGAAIVRVHDVGATVDALNIWLEVHNMMRQRNI